jgi:antitoxin component of RelBE/YafQ-DinJ toxin-antitoxin module
MRQFNVRVPDDLYEQARVAAESRGITLSDFVRDCVSQACRKRDSSVDTHVLDVLRSELDAKNEQIDHAHQLVAISQKSIQQLTEQNQLLLEDQRRRKLPLLKRIFRWT